MSGTPVTLRPYDSADETDVLSLWREAWQQAYPDIDFAARMDWWRTRWRDELTARAEIVVAVADRVIGFVTVERASGYLDQIVVAPPAWGAGTAGRLMDAAKAISPAGLVLHVNADNARALAFYRRHGFTVGGNDINPRSGAPTYRLLWSPQPSTGRDSA